MTLFIRVVRNVLLVGLAVAGILWIFGNERTNVWHTPSVSPAAPGGEISVPRNLTKTVSAEIAGGILEQNRGGPQASGDELAVIVNPADILERLTVVTKDLETSLPTVSDGELTIAFTETNDSKEAYAVALDTILGSLDESGAPTILDAFQSVMFRADTKPIALLIERHDATIRALKKLPVPLSLVPLHKEEILLLEKTNLMLNALASYPSDPLRAYVAFQAYPKLGEAAHNLQNKFLAYFEKENIAF